MKFIAVPPTIWSIRTWIEKNACTEPQDSTGHDPARARPPTSRHVRPPDAEESTGQHHPLERDVDHPAALGESPPSAAKISGVAKRSVAARSAPHAKTGRGRRRSTRVARTPPATPASPAATAPRPPAAQPCLRPRSRTRAEDAATQDRHQDRPRAKRRQSQPGRERTPSTMPTCARPRARRARRRARAELASGWPSRPPPQRRRHRVSTSTSAPMKSRMSPWIINVRLPASSGGKIVRIEVPRRGAGEERAEEQGRKPIPIAVLRPSRATAMPMKPIVEA